MINYFKDNTKPSFFPIFLGIISALIGFAVWFICMGKPAEAKPNYYALATVVTAIDSTEDAIICEDCNGNVWAFYGVEDWQVGDNANLLMHDNGTKSIYDDVICDATYANWVLTK